MIESIAKQAGVDLGPILKEASRRNAVQRRYVGAALDRMQAQVAQQAGVEGKRSLQIRRRYLSDFRDRLSADAGTTELKFRDPIAWSKDAEPGRCVGGSGTFEASAEIVVGRPGAGTWLHPRIHSEQHGDCNVDRPGRTFQDLTFRLPAPESSYLVSGVRVDLIGTGVAMNHFGDPGCFQEINTAYEHSFIELDVYIAQHVDGQWQEWPLVADPLFKGNGEYVRQVRPILSGQTYPANILLRGLSAAGGDLLCHLQLACSTEAISNGGRAGIDFATGVLGVFVGGVALLGESV